MRNFNWKNPAILMLAAFIWGSAFVAQSVGMDYVEPLTFNSVRSIVGGIVLIPCIFLLEKLKSPEERGKESVGNKKTLLTGGLCCGVILCLATNLQQIGIVTTSVGKAGFLTAIYIVIGYFFEASLRPQSVAGRADRACRVLPVVYDGGIFAGGGRRVSARLCAALFLSYTGN